VTTENIVLDKGKATIKTNSAIRWLQKGLFLSCHKYQYYSMAMGFEHKLLQTSYDVLEMQYFNFQTWNDTRVVPFSVSFTEMMFWTL
jgi:hypothetical protein